MSDFYSNMVHRITRRNDRLDQSTPARDTSRGRRASSAESLLDNESFSDIQYTPNDSRSPSQTRSAMRFGHSLSRVQNISRVRSLSSPGSLSGFGNQGNSRSPSPTHSSRIRRRRSASLEFERILFSPFVNRCLYGSNGQHSRPPSPGPSRIPRPCGHPPASESNYGFCGGRTSLERNATPQMNAAASPATAPAAIPGCSSACLERDLVLRDLLLMHTAMIVLHSLLLLLYGAVLLL